jgi:guanylate kinase
MNKCLVIIGPSGAGKSTVIRQLALDNVLSVQPTWTTRPPRTGERQESLEHEFVDDDTFQAMHARGEFLGTVQLFGLPFWYGLPQLATPAEGVVTVMLRAPLVSQFQQHYPDHVIYHIYDDKQVVASRIQEREAQGEAVGKRLVDYEKEVQLGNHIAHRTFKNTDLDTTVAAIKQAITEDF